MSVTKREGGTAEPDHARPVPGDLVAVGDLTVLAADGRRLAGPVTFRIPAGTVTALTGPSGSGKTTVMRALLGQLPSASARATGSASVAGHDVLALDAAALRRFRRQHIAYVGQDPGSALNPLLRVRALLREVAPKASEATLTDTLALVGLSTEYLRRRPGELSGGQQRRVALARALIRRPGVLVLDEPLAGLHGALRTDIAGQLAALARERSAAILLSGHDTALVHSIADDVVELGSVHPASLRGGQRETRTPAPTFGARAVKRPSATLPARSGDGPALGARAERVPMPDATAGVSRTGGFRPEETGSADRHEQRTVRDFEPSEFASSPLGEGRDTEASSPAGIGSAHSGPARTGGRTGVGPRRDIGAARAYALPPARNGHESAADATGDRTRDEVVLRAEGVSASIDGQQVLADIGLALGAGSALAVVGASGAGKTTLARVIAGLHRSATGLLELRGERIAVGARRRIRYGAGGIQLVTQNPRSALNPRRTVAQTLGRPLRRIGGVARRDLPRRIAELLAAVELSADLADRYPHELSGGQRQRVALARALAAEPAVLLCDEITSALDHTTAAAIMGLLDRIRAERGTALLIITHDLALVAEYCPALLVLDHGRIVESGHTATVLAAPAHDATGELLV
ncbi:ABC transporter ATP-binding protein [Nocardia barduliensis]|uniref:ABC transporter ATP-binding protein n=1 Tax=Nocardia barduliensis TaxID=2736643 RepID=UPI0028A5E8A9|nr:ATP-binding cassette domain-containing protein [Nocardia barduliensis]